MLIIKRVPKETKNSNWQFEWDTLVKIQDDVDRKSGYRIQLEEIEALLLYLEENFVLNVTQKEN